MPRGIAGVVHTKAVGDSAVAFELTGGGWAIVDLEDSARVLLHRWVLNNKRCAYFRYKTIGKDGNIKVSAYCLQRFILELGLHGDGDSDTVLFRDGDSLNCRKSNLVQRARRRTA